MIRSFRLYLIYIITALLGCTALAASVVLFIYGFCNFIALSSGEDAIAFRAMLFMIWIAVVFAVTCIFGITGVMECVEKANELVGED